MQVPSIHGKLLAVLGACYTLACGQAADEPASRQQDALLSGTALFVAGSSTLNDADNRLRNNLETMGLQVLVKSASSATSADANGKVMIVISSTVSPSAVNTKFRTATVPLLTWESELYDDLGMTPTSAGSFGTQSGQKSLNVSAGHPLAAGLSGTQLVFNEPNTPSLTTTFNWGKPNTNAAKVATIPSDSTRIAVFGYDSGASMPGLVAPARRVGFFAGDTSASKFTPNGWAMFQAAVNWALGASPPTGTDTDGDRLPDSVETNTGQFVNANNTGTDPNNSDSDGDGIKDGDEVLGTTDGLNLPALGTSPVHKNILLEYDWFNDSIDCGNHSHRPTPASIAMVAAAFANSPVSNPDGTTGITLIQDYGQGGAFTGGNAISDANGVLVGGVWDTEFVNYKTTHFGSSRFGYFHYVIMPHYYDTNSGSSGQAEIVGDDMIVSLYCANTDQNVANTIMHELGHNLGLHHGGFDGTNYKPNYNSVMNYLYQFPGVDTNCTPPGDGLLDYARNPRNTLDETALREQIGICNNVPWDWNSNGVIDPGTVHADVNYDQFESTLEGFDDWANLVYRWQSSSSRLAQRTATCDNPAPLP